MIEEKPATKGEVREIVTEVVTKIVDAKTTELAHIINNSFAHQQMYMDGKFDAIDVRFDKLEKRMDKIETRVTKLELA